MIFDRNKPYNELPLLPPKNVVLENNKILKKVIKARVALASLDASNLRLPNQNLLANAIILQEAKLSSEIENIVTTIDSLYKAAVADKIYDPNLKEVVSYPRALWQGYKFVQQHQFISTRTLVDIVQIIKHAQLDIRKNTGTKIENSITHEVMYTPPEGESIIREKLKNLEQYMNDQNDDIDPLIKMAVLHYQLEAIHPFTDGNGRTGRIINILFLLMVGLIQTPVLYLSKYILENKSAYYQNIRLVTEKQAWEDWILYMLTAVEETAKYTKIKVDAICLLMDRTAEKIKKDSPKIYSQELIQVLFNLPYCKRQFLVTASIAKEKTAGKYLAELERIGILTVEKLGREKLYFHPAFFNILKQ